VHSSARIPQLRQMTDARPTSAAACRSAPISMGGQPWPLSADL
jgi:hypothetical protein